MKPSRLVAMKTDAFTGYGPEKMVVVVSGSWPFGSGGCDRRDSDPHGLPHGILSPARLPVPPRSRDCPASTYVLLGFLGRRRLCRSCAVEPPGDAGPHILRRHDVVPCSARPGRPLRGGSSSSCSLGRFAPRRSVRPRPLERRAPVNGTTTAQPDATCKPNRGLAWRCGCSVPGACGSRLVFRTRALLFRRCVRSCVTRRKEDGWS